MHPRRLCLAALLIILQEASTGDASLSDVSVGTEAAPACDTKDPTPEKIQAQATLDRALDNLQERPSAKSLADALTTAEMGTILGWDTNRGFSRMQLAEKLVPLGSTLKTWKDAEQRVEALEEAKRLTREQDYSRLDAVRNSDVGRALEAALDTIRRERQSPSCTLISKLVSREHLATLLGWGSHRGFDSLQLAQKLESTLQQHPKWLRAEQAVGDQQARVQELRQAQNMANAAATSEQAAAAQAKASAERASKEQTASKAPDGSHILLFEDGNHFEEIVLPSNDAWLVMFTRPTESHAIKQRSLFLRHTASLPKLVRIGLLECSRGDQAASFCESTATLCSTYEKASLPYYVLYSRGTANTSECLFSGGNDEAGVPPSAQVSGAKMALIAKLVEFSLSTTEISSEEPEASDDGEDEAPPSPGSDSGSYSAPQKQPELSGFAHAAQTGRQPGAIGSN